MASITLRSMVGITLALAGFLTSSSGHAITVQIDEFSVQKDGTSFFADTFSNNLTPTQEPGTYGVTGAFPAGAESGGSLTLNSDWGEPTTNALGQSRSTLGVQLLSNVNPANPAAGLTSANQISVAGTFGLTTPSGPLINGYGIQVQDIVLGQGQTRVAELDVQYNDAFGGEVIRFLLQDFTTNTITTLGWVPLAAPAGADQVRLQIGNAAGDTTDFFGSYAFGTAGSFGPWSTFATSAGLFTDTDFVRARFIDYTDVAPIPEPGTLALVGVAALAGFARRRHP